MRYVLVLLVGLVLGAAIAVQRQDTVALRTRAKSIWRTYVVGQFAPADRATLVRRAKRIGLGVVAVVALWLVGYVGVKGFASRGAAPPARWFDGEPNENAAGVAVVVHGWTMGPDDMEQVAAVVREVHPDHAVRLWAYDSRRLSNEDPRTIARRLNDDVAALHADVGGDVILVGHSLGGLLVRRAYVDAVRENAAWSRNVSRIALLAAPNRGTRAIYESRTLWALDALTRSYRVGQLIRSTYRGDPFLVTLRLDWIATMPGVADPPAIVQVLGGDDTLVSPRDSRDVLQFPGAFERTVYGVDHASIIDDADGLAALRDVLRATPPPVDAPLRDDEVLKVLVVHGIRDYAEGFDELQTFIEDEATARGLVPIVRSPRYEYFSAFQFVNPLSRRRKVHEFADRYAELLAAPPSTAPIHFAGHSFGTYLLGNGLETYPSMRFERIYLAGSVLDEDFAWDERTSQWSFVRNDTAVWDWPVGILCSGLHGLRLAPSIGTGGFNGFTHLPEGRSIQNRHLPGGHGEFMAYQDNIASWITAPTTDMPDASRRELNLRSSRPGLWTLASRAAPALLLLVVGLFAYLVLVGRHPWLGLAEGAVVLWLLTVI